MKVSDKLRWQVIKLRPHVNTVWLLDILFFQLLASKQVTFQSQTEWIMMTQKNWLVLEPHLTEAASFSIMILYNTFCTL